MDVWTDGWADRGTDGWIGWMDRMDGEIDGWMEDGK